MGTSDRIFHPAGGAGRLLAAARVNFIHQPMCSHEAGRDRQRDMEADVAKTSAKWCLPYLADGLNEVSDYLLGEVPPFFEFAVDSGF
jgi:hypothetical protein